MTEAASFGLSDQCDPRLLSIINKGLACISSEQLDSIVLQNCSYREDPSLFTLVYAYPRISIPIILAVSMALLSLLLGILLVHSRKTKEIRVMSETDALTVFITGGLPKIIFQDKCRKMAKILTVYVH